MMVAWISGARLVEPLFLSTVTPGKLPTFWFRPVRALKRELFPLFGLPMRAIGSVFCFNVWAGREAGGNGRGWRATPIYEMRNLGGGGGNLRGLLTFRSR